MPNMWHVHKTKRITCTITFNIQVNQLCFLEEQTEAWEAIRGREKLNQSLSGKVHAWTLQPHEGFKAPRVTGPQVFLHPATAPGTGSGVKLRPLTPTQGHCVRLELGLPLGQVEPVQGDWTTCYSDAWDSLTWGPGLPFLSERENAGPLWPRFSQRASQKQWPKVSLHLCGSWRL